MSDNKFVKTVIDAATLTGLAAGIGWAAKKVVKEKKYSPPAFESGALPRAPQRGEDHVILFE